jgi:prepilin-type N-terminal cleavage/methylation domain-containing protein
MTHLRRGRTARGFTLIELVLVITIMGLMVGMVSVRLSDMNFWKEEAALKKLSETIVFLNNQAIMDQSFYRMDFDLENRQYRINVVKNESPALSNPSGINLPPLQMELAALLSPDMGDESTLIPPPSYPSLAEPTTLPGMMKFRDVLTPRGKVSAGDKRESPYLIFSPRGTSEFGVIHLDIGPDDPVTILVNPWTGLAETYREYKEFKWTLGKQSTN